MGNVKRVIIISLVLIVAYLGVTADALELMESKLTASDGAEGDNFGESVSISGDWAIVGAHVDDDKGEMSGSAYVYGWNGSAWVEQQKLTASDGAAKDFFGESVSISGDRAIVGAFYDDNSRGSAYVYGWNGSAWVEQQKLTASDGTAFEEFGTSVSISGDRAIVGAPMVDARGAAYVYGWNGSAWVEQQKLTASDRAGNDYFGWSVSISGDWAIVGAYYAGAAYVYGWNGSAWVEQQKLTASDGAAKDFFGESVSISGDRAIVGAFYDDNSRGSAYVYGWNGSAWVEQQKLTASAGSVSISGDWAIVGGPYIYGWNGSAWVEQKFIASGGRSVSISGDRAIVGAPNSGSAYVYQLVGSVWGEQQKLTASDGAADDWFGFSVSISGDRAIVGAPLDDDKGDGSGSAYIYFTTVIVKEPPIVTITSPETGDIVYGKVPIKAEVSDADNDVLEVSFLVDSIALHPIHVVTNTVTPQEVVHNLWTFPDFADGEHIITVIADDGMYPTPSEPIHVIVKNAVNVEGHVIERRARGEEAPVEGALLELLLNDEVKYSDTTDGNGAYRFEDVTPNLRYTRQLTRDDELTGVVPKNISYKPGVDVLDEEIKIKNFSVVVKCPVNIHAYDEQGRHTGLIGDEIELGIPHSWYSGDMESEVINVRNPSDFYRVVVEGTSNGIFNLYVSNYIVVDDQGIPQDTLIVTNVEGIPINEGQEISLTYNYAELAQQVSDGSSVQEAIDQIIEVPTVIEVTASPEPVQVGVEVSASVGFVNPGLSDIHTVVWNWGDSSTSTGNVSASEASSYRSVTGSHTYTEAGVYTIGVTVTDDDGCSDEATFQYVVIYDPEGGFVTGGGWINSPEGAYADDPSLTGKANFGFVSKYKKEANVPTGNTQFNFHVADLSFHSTSYQWLVVAGHQAKFKGDGTINGDGDYGFMLSAIDADLTPITDVDRFRIKIWDRDTGDTVIYDNQMGADDDAGLDPDVTAIVGGSIVIHKDNVAPMDESPFLPEDTCALLPFPQPANPEIWIPYQLSEDVDVTIMIYSVSGRLIRTLDLGYKPAGFYTIRQRAAYWNGTSEAGEQVSSGVYFYTIQAGDFTATKKMVVAK